jgi:hypothetical protein
MNDKTFISVESSVRRALETEACVATGNWREEMFVHP